MILHSIAKTYSQSAEFYNYIQHIEKEKTFSVEGISPSSFPLIIASSFIACPGQYLVVVDSTQKMQELALDIACFVGENEIYTVPPWETLPYEYVSPPEHVERERITALFKMLKGDHAIFVTTLEAVLRKLPDKEFLMNKGFDIAVNDEVPYDDLIEMIVEYGYTRETRVESFGQFSVKGGIIDIFLPSHENPVRLDFFGDTLESVREFNIASQVSQNRLDSVTIYPRKELVLFQKERDEFTKVMREAVHEGLDIPDEVHNQVESGSVHEIKGIEDIFPLAIPGTSLPAYMAGNVRTILVEPQELVSKKNLLEKTFTELYNKKKTLTLCLPPEQLIDLEKYDELARKSVVLQVFTTTPEALQFEIKSIRNFRGKIKDVREEIAEKNSNGWRVVITTGFEGQARRLFDLLSEFDPDSDFDSYNPDNTVNIILAPLRGGFEAQDSRIVFLTDHDIFGKSYRKKKRFKRKSSRPIESFLDLNENDYVVHINHGIGVFKGIERMSAGGVERDFLMIEYSDGDKLYVSLDQITMVQKYIGIEGRKPRIDNLGRKSAWNRIKQKVQEEVEKMAHELLEIYAKRNAQKGFPYPPDTLWQEEFESNFEYEETPDQITAIEDVKDDMEKSKPMDRLVCGDVGFGKTEVAIRASFKAVMAGKQVAILAPTTILTMQHYSTFNKRFADYPVTVEMLSRFKSRSEINKIKVSLKDGKVDIVIGTHALIARDVEIKNLGLLIIDEEQRFGVKHKERLKQLKSQVDVLTLSATPIPRTLHMSMAGIRDLSIIMTPPENRQTIETYVMEENPDIMRAAIKREIDREGQVFFVHNRVQTIDAQAAMLETLIPEATFCVAHGQMGEHELEQIMIDFMNRQYDVLISTTIIESGLDMPNVNTIIVNRADMFGLSQLYQLKGRVGRSIRKAYAYMFYPKHVSLTEEAQKRLRVIAEYSELGSGFKVAMKDLEIRGAGNLLGKEQSGTIMEVGFELYTSMLEDTVKRLKGEDTSQFFRTPVFFNTDFFIPDSYINDKRQKIEFYKRFESCEDLEEIAELENEMIDRFGKPPKEVNVLVEHEKIRTIASRLYLDEVREDSKAIRIKISNNSRIDREKLVVLLTHDDRVSFDRDEKDILVFAATAANSAKKLEELKDWLQQIS